MDERRLPTTPVAPGSRHFLRATHSTRTVFCVEDTKGGLPTLAPITASDALSGKALLPQLWLITRSGGSQVRCSAPLPHRRASLTLPAPIADVEASRAHAPAAAASNSSASADADARLFEAVVMGDLAAAQAAVAGGA